MIFPIQLPNPIDPNGETDNLVLTNFNSCLGLLLTET